MAKKRKRRKGENPVREWISDNLRYLLLILIVVIAALAAFLIYREVSDRRSVISNTPTAETTVSSSAASVTAPKATPEEAAASASSASSTSSTSASSTSEASSSSSETTEIVTATPTAAPEETPEATPEPELTEMVPAATEAVQSYFYNLQAEGENENVEYYDSIHVQTYPGPIEGTYIAYADYDYKYWNYDATVPGLTEFYLAPDTEGTLQVITEVPTDVQAYIAKVRQTADVQDLIVDVQTRYKELMDSDPELSAFVSGIS